MQADVTPNSEELKNDPTGVSASDVTRGKAGFFSAYPGVFHIVSSYWEIYGGWRDFCRSPYVHLSGILALLSYGSWTAPDWWGQVLSVLPNLIGFSVGAFAIFLGFGDSEFQTLMAGKKDEKSMRDSTYLKASAAFTHFIVVQVLAVIVALLFFSFYKVPLIDNAPPVLIRANEVVKAVGWFFGYWLFLYAVTLTVGTVMVIFRASRWFDIFVSKTRRR